MSISDAIRLKPAARQLKDGTPYWLRRPTALDVVDAIEFAKANEAKMHAWLCWRHLMDHEDGILKPVFDTLDQALAADAALVFTVGTEADKLYSEGRD